MHTRAYLTSLSSEVDERVSVHYPSVVSEDILPSLALHLNSIEVLSSTNHIEIPAPICRALLNQ
jgi:hypothetical protein